MMTRPPAVAATMAFTTFVLFQVANVFNARFERTTSIGRHALTNRGLWVSLLAVVVLQIAAVHVSPLQSVLDTAALSAGEWLLAVCVAASVLVLDELRKLVQRGIRARRAPARESTSTAREHRAPPQHAPS